VSAASPAVPAPEDKAGVKIDYVAKRLALALAPLGFKRKGRLLTLAAGEGDAAHWKIVHVQAGKWNEGPRGEFYVNLVVQYPALMRLAAQRQGMEWLLEHLDKPGEATGQASARLGQLMSALPPEHACARPGRVDEWKFSRHVDIEPLADAVVRGLLEVGVPWLEQHGTLRALADHEESLLVVDVDMRIAAAVLLGDHAHAQRVLVERQGRFTGNGSGYWQMMRPWLAALGLDVSVLPAEAEPPRVSAWEQRREAEARAEEAAHAREAASIRAQAQEAPLEPPALAAAWLAELQAAWRSDPKPLTDLPSGRDAASRDAPGREAVLLGLLDRLLADEKARHTIHAHDRPAGALDLDENVKTLLEALLPTLPAVSAATARAVLERLTALVDRWSHELVTGAYAWGFAPLVKWLGGPAGAPHLAALQPAIAAWLEAYARFAVRRFDRDSKWLAAELAKPLDPNDPMYEVLKEGREQQAEMAAKAPLTEEELRRRIAAYPEQQMAAPDKRAVAALRQALRRDPASGRLRLEWEDDDWGASTRQAWEAADPALRTALAPALQDWLEGVDPQPTRSWLKTLDVRIAALPAALAPVWRQWLLQRLGAFEAHSGRTEWATTGARPGIGARLGEASENLLLGLLWWAWRDAAVEPIELEAALQRFAAGAWAKLPDVGARAPSPGGVVLRMLAGLGGDALDSVQRRAAERGASKQLKQAVERALKQPMPR
jgi:hypothetical protein